MNEPNEIDLNDANGQCYQYSNPGMTKLEHFSLEIFKHMDYGPQPELGAESAVNKALILLDAIARRSALVA